MFFNSNDKDKFVVGVTYWTYYMDLSNNRTIKYKLKNYF